MKIGELFVALGIKTDQAAIARFNTGINNLKKDIFLMTAAFVGATAAIDRFVDGTVKGVVSLQNLQNQTGLSIEKLQKLQQVGQLADLTLTPEAISQSVANLQKNITEITRLGKGNFRPFQLLGIDPTSGDAFNVIDQLRDRIRGLDPAIATNLIQELGLSPQFINILKLSREEFEKLSENTFLSPQQRNLVLQAGTAMTRLKIQMKALKDQSVAKLAPLLTEITEKFFIWIKENGKKVADTITSVVRAMTLFVTTISRAIGFVTSLVEGLFGIENGFKAIIAILGALSLALLPFKSIMLIGTAIILILEDISVWARGGRSVFKGMFDAIKYSLIDFGSLISKTFLGAFEKIKSFFDRIKAQMTDFFLGMQIEMQKFAEMLLAPFTKIEEAFNRLTSRLGGFIFDKFDKGNMNLNMNNNLLPVNNQGASNNDNRSTTNNINVNQEVTVEGEASGIVGEMKRAAVSLATQLGGAPT